VGTISSEAFFSFNAESLAPVDSRQLTTLDMKKTIELGLFTRNCHPPNPRPSRCPSPEQLSPSASPKFTASMLPSASRVWSSGGGGQAVLAVVEGHLTHLNGAQSAGHLVGKPGSAASGSGGGKSVIHGSSSKAQPRGGSTRLFLIVAAAR
jgi:hypothetical protein